MSSSRWGDGDSSHTVEHVMSEVHLGCPPRFNGHYQSQFTFSVPSGARFQSSIATDETIRHTRRCQTATVDDDGDLILTRRSKRELEIEKNGVTIQHKITSSIPSVGLQVWRAELVLADFLMHNIFMTSELDGVVAMELGAGTGMAGILLALVAETVFITDYGHEILENCSKNVYLNSKIFKHQTSVHVRDLDWRSSWPPSTEHTDSPCTIYSWISSDINKIQKVSLLLAADVIYDDGLTNAFFLMLEKIMSHGLEKVLYLALERRFNFTLEDLDVVANGYLRFRSYVVEEEDNNDDGERDDLDKMQFPCFVGKKMDLLQIPQYINEYSRGNDIELWKIEYKRFL